MKRLFTSITVLLAATGVSFAQTVTITDGDLEAWTTTTGPNGTYDDPTGGFLSTLNELNDLPAQIGGPGPITVFKDTPACQGEFAAKLVSGKFNPPFNFFVPGALGTFTIDIATQSVKFGKPFTQRPGQLQYCAKYNSVTGDSAEVFALLTKWNGSSRDTIAFGNMIHTGSIASYTQFAFNLEYSSADTPDTLSFLATASAGYNFSNLTASQGQVGSTFWVDNIRFDMTPIGVNEVLSGYTVAMYPSPATDVLNISVDKLTSATAYRIYDVTGRTVLNGNITENKNLINIGTLATGTYYVQVTNAAGIIANKQIVKQ